MSDFIYSTGDEMRFVSGLAAGFDKKARLEELRRYLETMRNRTDWGYIEPEIVRMHVIALIARIEGMVG